MMSLRMCRGPLLSCLKVTSVWARTSVAASVAAPATPIYQIEKCKKLLKRKKRDGFREMDTHTHTHTLILTMSSFVSKLLSKPSAELEATSVQ